MLKRTASITIVLVVIWGVLSIAQDFVTFKDQPSQDLFVASRAAVARGEGSVKDLTGLILKGRARMLQDDGSQGNPPWSSFPAFRRLERDGLVKEDPQRLARGDLMTRRMGAEESLSAEHLDRLPGLAPLDRIERACFDPQRMSVLRRQMV
jgi:hypothetical protein